MRKYVPRNFKIKVQENFEADYFEKLYSQISLTFENNLRRKGLENFKQICNYSEILKKF